MEGCRESLAAWRCALVERKAAGEKGRESETSASEVRVSWDAKRSTFISQLDLFCTVFLHSAGSLFCTQT